MADTTRSAINWLQANISKVQANTAFAIGLESQGRATHADYVKPIKTHVAPIAHDVNRK
jgi:hypothetical protein